MIDFKNRYFPFSVIDFVAPYFDQSGISILLRKKKRETNVFKFLSVLKPEVSNYNNEFYGIQNYNLGCEFQKNQFFIFFRSGLEFLGP